MKRLITSIFVFCFTYSISAQTEQGQFLIIGESSFKSITQRELGYTIDGETPDWWEASNSQLTTTNGKLALGYFLTKRIALGVLAEYSATSIDYGESNLENPDPVSNMVYGAFTRYYIGGIAFLEASYSMQSSSEWDDLDETPSINTMAAGAGFALFLSKNIAFCPSVGYAVQTQTNPFLDVTNSTGNLIINAGINIHL